MQMIANNNPTPPISGMVSNQNIAPNTYIAEPIDPILFTSCLIISVPRSVYSIVHLCQPYFR